MSILTMQAHHSVVLFKTFSMVWKKLNINKFWSIKSWSKDLGHIETFSSFKREFNLEILGLFPFDFYTFSLHVGFFFHFLAHIWILAPCSALFNLDTLNIFYDWKHGLHWNGKNLWNFKMGVSFFYNFASSQLLHIRIHQLSREMA
jgi:hypothetical protein